MQCFIVRKSKQVKIDPVLNKHIASSMGMSVNVLQRCKKKIMFLIHDNFVCKDNLIAWIYD